MCSCQLNCYYMQACHFNIFILYFFIYVGTGKTLVARALANECSTNDRRVSFYMRKGADCLSKWVGESERQLRLLFDQVILIKSCVCLFLCIFLYLFLLGLIYSVFIPLICFYELHLP